MGNTISATEYADRRGVSRPAVLQAIRNGRLTKSVTREGRNYRINADLADKEWAATTSIDRGEHNNRMMLQDAGVEGETASYAASRAKKEAYEAELARLKYEQQAGTLIDAEAVKKEAFKVARMVRDGLLNIPDRVAAEVAGITDSFIIHRRLTDEIRKALEAALGGDDVDA
jgi:phage terminase Nu1 subunit (DNA packaging protein)